MKGRIAYIEVSPEWILDALRGSQGKYKTNLPSDAKVWGFESINFENVIRMVFESSKVGEINEGELIPRFQLLIERTDT